MDNIGEKNLLPFSQPFSVFFLLILDYLNIVEYNNLKELHHNNFKKLCYNNQIQTIIVIWIYFTFFS